jgi:hypothetical protein
MKYNIIKTDNYLLIGSDDEIRRGLFYCVRTKYIFQDEGEDIHCCMGDIRIIAHLPLNNSPVLQGVDLLPPLEDDVEKLAEEFKSSYKKVGVTDYEVSSFIVGYNKAKEKYKYTEEQLKTAIHKAIIFSEENRKITSGEYAVKFYKFYGELIQSLQQPKTPVAFECTAIDSYEQFGDNAVRIFKRKTTTSDGLTQWVGQYIY